LSLSDKLLLILEFLDHPSSMTDIYDCALKAGVRISTSANPSQALRRTKGMAIRVPDGWEITDAGRQRLSSLGIQHSTDSAIQVTSKLREPLKTVADTDVRAFLEEAIKCSEFKLYRSAIVMSWMAAMRTLHVYVLANYLDTFNAEAARVNSKWKSATTADDLAEMKERDFLERLNGISVIGKNVKTELIDCLNRRNGCGHPNSLKIGPSNVAHHFEVLVLNVFEPFAAQAAVQA
jgi:hypothetical protein